MKRKDLEAISPFSFPSGNLKVMEEKDGTLKIFDPIRKKYVALTPEEWVRQNFISWMTTYKGYPLSHIANEQEIKLNETKKRFDTMVYGREFNPLVIVEYKAPDVEITQQTFDQIVRYNMELRAGYLIVSNGLKTYCCKVDYKTNTYQFIPTVPDYMEACGMPMEN